MQKKETNCGIIMWSPPKKRNVPLHNNAEKETYLGIIMWSPPKKRNVPLHNNVEKGNILGHNNAVTTEKKKCTLA